MEPENRAEVPATTLFSKHADGGGRERESGAVERPTLKREPAYGRSRDFRAVVGHTPWAFQSFMVPSSEAEAKYEPSAATEKALIAACG